MKIIEKDGAAFIAVKVVPNSSRTALAGFLGDALKVKIAQPAESGKANRALLAFLAEAFDVPSACITLVSGESQARKTIRIVGLPVASIVEKLKRLES